MLGLTCVKCGRHHEEFETLYHCEICGPAGILDVRYDYTAVRTVLSRISLERSRDYSMWRYLPILPLSERGVSGIQPLRVGFTPLYEVESLRFALGMADLYVKDDSRNPTGSLKDRASAVGIAKAIELGRGAVCAASTGNAASSLAGFAASAGIPSYIFVPSSAPQAKIAQLLVFGATVFLVEGTYDEAFDLCLQAAEEFGWYNRSCAINPYLVEGKKTLSLEICEQLNWQVPDVVIMSVGDGCSIAAAWKGFKECVALGLTDKLPKMIGVQASGANPVTRAYNSGSLEFDYVKPKTIADSIEVGRPRNGIKALRAVRESGGFYLDVTDDEILEALVHLARHTGLFGEPAGVTGYAGLRRMLKTGALAGNEKTVIALTGSGLKDIKSAMQAVSPAITVSPDIKSVRKAMEVSRHDN